MSAAVFDERERSGYSGSFALSFAMHAILLTVLFLGVRWQSHPPQAVSVELWEPPAPPVVAPKAPAPVPKVEPAPPPKAEPKIEKPDIVEKPAPKPKPKPEPKVEPKPKPPPPKPKPDDREFKRQLQAQLAQEQAAAQDRQIKQMIAQEQAAANSRALATWVDKIRSKIRSNILLPPDLVGNPEAVYQVTLLPTGEVLPPPKLIKSSGSKGYDDAIERAILKSSPLPKPEPASLFQRRLELTFRPRDP